MQNFIHYLFTIGVPGTVNDSFFKAAGGINDDFEDPLRIIDYAMIPFFLKIAGASDLAILS